MINMTKKLILILQGEMLITRLALAKALDYPIVTQYTMQDSSSVKHDKAYLKYLSDKQMLYVNMIRTGSKNDKLYYVNAQEIMKLLNDNNIVIVLADAQGVKLLKEVYGNKALSVYIHTDLLDVISYMERHNDNSKEITEYLSNYVSEETYEAKKICDLILDGTKKQWFLVQRLREFIYKNLESEQEIKITPVLDVVEKKTKIIKNYGIGDQVILKTKTGKEYTGVLIDIQLESSLIYIRLLTGARYIINLANISNIQSHNKED